MPGGSMPFSYKLLFRYCFIALVLASLICVFDWLFLSNKPIADQVVDLKWANAERGDLVVWQPDGVIYIFDRVYYDDGLKVWTGLEPQSVIIGFGSSQEAILIKQDSPEYPSKAVEFIKQVSGKKEKKE